MNPYDVTLSSGTASTAGYGGTYTTANYFSKSCGRCGYSEMRAEYTSMTFQCRACGAREEPYQPDFYQQQIMMTQRDFYQKYMADFLPQSKPEPAPTTPINELEQSPKVEGEQNKEKDKVMELKKGDRVTTCDRCCSAELDTVYTMQLTDSGSLGIGSDSNNLCSCLSNWTLSKEKQSMLQPLEALSNLIQRTFSEDTKTLYRAGYLSSDLNITKKLTDAVGEMFVGHIIDGTIAKVTFESMATELITQAKKEISDAEKAEKK